MTSAMVVAVALGGLVSFLDLGWQSVTVLVIGLFSLFVWTLYRSQADLLYQRKIYPQFLRPEQVRRGGRPRWQWRAFQPAGSVARCGAPPEGVGFRTRPETRPHANEQPPAPPHHPHAC